MSSYLDHLNPVQRAAVEATEGPVLVVAGPGSGKTRVLTFRIARLIEKGVPPWQILALTFTNKAAREMKARIAQVVGDKANTVWAGTFHSIFARILRVEAEKIGYPSNFTIYDTDDSKSVINAIIKDLQLDKNAYGANGVLSRISSAKSNLITPKLYELNDDLLEQDNTAKRPQLHKVYTEYVLRCKRSGAMDFDDLLFRLYELFQKNPDNILEKYRQKFQYVLVDEFQDTNYLQYAIVKKLIQFEQSHRNICVVGDDAQSIYAFRGATIQNILDFETDFQPFDIQVFKLEQNYRSTEHIVQAANSVILNNRRQIQKRIWSDKGGGNKINLIRALTDTEEGKRVADTIVEYKNRFHLANKEIAILYRTNAQSRIFEEYLRRYNVAYKVFGGLSFYQRKEVKDLLAYLRLAVNQRDDEAFRRVVNFPKRGIGNSTVDKISQLALQKNLPLWEAQNQTPLSERPRRSLDKFKAIIESGRQKAQVEDAYTTALSLAHSSGLLDLLKSDVTIEGVNRLENVNALLDGIKTFVEEDEFEDAGGQTDKSLATYLQNIALITDFDSDNASGDYVHLMSVHSAKGLEFKAVFLVGLEEKLFPSFMSMDSPDNMDEERRLFYVAITRAEQFLTLTYASSRYRFGQMRYNEPSRFLEEIPGDHLLTTITGPRQTPAEAGGNARLTGVFKDQTTARNAAPAVDPSSFKPSPSASIQAGMQVLHLKFGKGKVLRIDGGPNNRIATIQFRNIDRPERRIMLKFAKLQILS